MQFTSIIRVVCISNNEVSFELCTSAARRLPAAHREEHGPEDSRLVLLERLSDSEQSILFVGQLGVDKELLEFSFIVNGSDSFELGGVEVGH